MEYALNINTASVIACARKNHGVRQVPQEHPPLRVSIFIQISGYGGKLSFKPPRSLQLQLPDREPFAKIAHERLLRQHYFRAVCILKEIPASEYVLRGAVNTGLTGSAGGKQLHFFFPRELPRVGSMRRKLVIDELPQTQAGGRHCLETAGNDRG